MKKAEHLLICLTEECAELQQAISKALRFGLDDGNPNGTTTNAQDIIRECLDVTALIELITDDEAIVESPSTEEAFKAIKEKKEKVKKYMDYAIKRGTLEREYVYDDSDSFADWEKG